MFSEDQKKQIAKYIDKCNGLLQSNDIESLDFCVQEIISIFGQIIPNIRSELKSTAYHFNKSVDGYQRDIKLLRNKLEFFLEFGTDDLMVNKASSAINLKNNNMLKDSGNSTNTNTNTNTNTVSTSFDIKSELDKARKEVEQNGYLDKEAKAEINEQLNKIDEVMSENSDDNDKWKKLSSVVNWVTSKGYKIGELVMPLITKALFPDIH